MTYKVQQDKRQVIIFDLDKTLINPFTEIEMQARKVWDKKIRPIIENYEVEEGVTLKKMFPELDLSLSPEDLMVPSNYDSKKGAEEKPGKILIHRLYPVLREYHKFKNLHNMSFEKLKNLSEQVEGKKTSGGDVDEIAVLKDKSIKQFEKHLKLTANMDRQAGRARSVFSEILANKIRDYKGEKSFNAFDRAVILEKLGQELRKHPIAHGHEIIHQLDSVRYTRKQFLKGMKELLEKFNDPEKYVVMIATNQVPEDPNNLDLLFGPKGKIPACVNRDLVFTQLDGDKELHTSEDEKNPPKKRDNKPRPGVPSLVRTIKERAAEQGVTDEMLKNACYVGDLDHDFVVAQALGCNFIRTTLGQDEFYKPKLEGKCEKYAAEQESRGKVYEVVDSAAELALTFKKLGLFRNPERYIGQSSFSARGLG